MSFRSSRPKPFVSRWAAPLIAVLASSAGARADPVPVAWEDGQRSVGVGATIGVWSGLGGIVGGFLRRRIASTATLLTRPIARRH